MINLEKVQEVCVKFCNDVELLQKEIKRIQSVKCRLKKQKGKKSYQDEMTEVLQQEQILKEAKNLLEPKEKPVTMYTLADIKKLDYDETVKAIRSIQSKKTLTKWLNDEAGNNDEYRKACEIEQMLLEHKLTVAPVDDLNVRKTEIQTIIDVLEENVEVDKNRILALLQKLL